MSDDATVVEGEEVEVEELSFEDAVEQVTGEKAVHVDDDGLDDNLTDKDGKKVVADADGDKKEKDTDKDGADSGEPESEIDKLRRDFIRLSGHNSKLQQELNQKAKVVRTVKAPVIDENGVFTDSFSELKKEFPEADFGRVEDIIRAQNEQISKLANQVQQTNNNFQQTQKSDFLKSQMDDVHAIHPDFKEAVTSTEFAEWQQSLPPETQQMITSTNDAKSIGVILDNFKSVTGYKSKAMLEAESKDEAERTAGKRKRRESASVGVSTKQPSSPSTGGADGFNEAAEMNMVYEKLGVPH